LLTFAKNLQAMIEIIGYLGSVFVASAMLFNSILRLRWLSLTGSTLFTIYGFTIGAYPVGAVNGFIMMTNIYYLSRMYAKKEYFRTLAVRPDNKYLEDFLDFNKSDIQKFFPGFVKKPYAVSLLVLRNMQVAGVFLAEESNQQMEVKLDYVTPAYRDFKLGNYVYNVNLQEFKDKEIKSFVCESQSKKHDKYLQKLGFKKQINTGAVWYIKLIP
jgi:hypothetical protein